MHAMEAHADWRVAANAGREKRSHLAKQPPNDKAISFRQIPAEWQNVNA
jgi:hypothetical protein